MARIGSRTIAREVHNGDYTNVESLSGGGTRTAFLDRAAGVVYKIEHYEVDQYGNLNEYRVASRLLAKCRSNDYWLNEYVRIPEVSLFQFKAPTRYAASTYVIAMAFIEGRTMNAWSRDPSDYLSPEAHRALFGLGFHDMHGANYVIDSGNVIWPIDMGSPRDRSDHRDRRCLHPSDPERQSHSIFSW